MFQSIVLLFRAEQDRPDWWEGEDQTYDNQNHSYNRNPVKVRLFVLPERVQDYPGKGEGDDAHAGLTH